MQIHELNTLSGKPVDTDFLPIDTGFDTAKISAPKLLEPKINRPLDENNQYDDGAAGQLLRSKGDGSTEWSNVGQPTDEQTAQAVNDWLDAHPEATTTVLDGSLTEAKFSNTLKLKTIKDYVTPEMFGAVGDGITDDTTAVQACFNSDFPTICLIGKYLVKNTIYVPYGKTRLIIGLTNPIRQAQLFTDVELNPLLSVESANMIFENVGFEYQTISENPLGTGVIYKNGTSNTDAQFIDCAFTGFSVCISHYGRGLRVQDCLFSTSLKCIVQQMEHSASETAEMQLPPYDGRGLRIINNRIHNVRNTAIFLTINDGGYGEKYLGAEISGNCADIGSKFLNSAIDFIDSVFADNVFINLSLSNNATATINGTSFTRCKFINNVFQMKEQTASSYMNNIILASGNLEECVIKNNTFFGFLRQAIAGTITKCVIDSNVFCSTVFDYANRTIILNITKSIFANNVIDVNAIDYMIGTANGSVVRGNISDVADVAHLAHYNTNNSVVEF